MFGFHGPVYSCSRLTASTLLSFLKDEKGFDGENEVDLENDGSFCSVCLGVLQLAYLSDGGMGNHEEKASTVEDFAARVVELIKLENHQIDGFCLEISIPPVIVANERALW